MHYLLDVPAFGAATGTDEATAGDGEAAVAGDETKPPAAGPANVAEAQEIAQQAGRDAFHGKLSQLDDARDETGTGYGERLLALVMLNVIDEKWKDHLYDLDQLRAAIHYRSWGQKDPLVEYKQEAYTLFVDLMNDVANTFTERFLRAQLVFEPPPEEAYEMPMPLPEVGGRRKRFNALGILEEVGDETEPAFG